jgi:hypothetical protein
MCFSYELNSSLLKLYKLIVTQEPLASSSPGVAKAFIEIQVEALNKAATTLCSECSNRKVLYSIINEGTNT